MSSLRRFIGNRRRSKRARVRLACTISISGRRISSNGFRRLPTIDGHTLDISNSGLALILPAIRIGEHYLAGADRKLHIKLELPDGPVEMKVATVRYEWLDDSHEETGYLIGARILEMSDTDRSNFQKYLAQLLKQQQL